MAPLLGQLRHERQQLVDDVGRGDAGHLRMVVGRSDLDDVGGDEVQAVTTTMSGTTPSQADYLPGEVVDRLCIVGDAGGCRKLSPSCATLVSHT